MSKTSQILIGCAAFTASLFVINPTVSQAQTVPQQVTAVRVGDRQMSCEALATEINQPISADAPAASAKKRGGTDFMRMLSAAS